MDATELRDAVGDAKATELSRLGSSKALYADTAGRLEADAVLRAAADAEYAAAETFEAWADKEEHHHARNAFEATAEEERDHVETVRAELEDYEPGDAELALPSHLRTVDATVERAGAMLGRILVADASKSQYVGYFTGNADPQTAGVFRDLRSDLDGQEERALALLDDVCAEAADWERAEAAAAESVAVAYDAHVEQLESLGVDPKPVC